jgi:hypothetical protein
LPSCTLEIGGRIVARAEGGPFDAEYALFEAHEIELRSNNEPGTVREHGYRSTAELARERLEAEGVTRTLAEDIAGELGALATSYARGPEVRRVVALLGPSELFEGRVWHAPAKNYEGGWLDLAALAADCSVENAGRAFQELYLASILADAVPETEIYLATTDYTAGRRPGERTYRRVSLASVAAIPGALRALADRQAPRSLREVGPTRVELLESIRARISAGVLDSSRIALDAIERALSLRDRPNRGPLADQELWALELQLADGDPTGVIEKIDAIERARGRQPGTIYLRARAALLLRSEDPDQLAERVSALAMSMNAFPELELLAAEAWAIAGDRKRAVAYAHNLADDPQVDSALRARARVIESPSHESATMARPPSVVGLAAPVRPPSVVGPLAPVRPPSVVAPLAPAPPPSVVAPIEPPPPSERSPQSSRTSSSPIMVAITAGLRGSVPSSRPPAPNFPAEAEPIAPAPIMSVGTDAPRGSSAPPVTGPELRASSSAIHAPASSAILASQRASQVSMRAQPTPAPAAATPSAPTESLPPSTSPRASPVPEPRPSLRAQLIEHDEDDEDDEHKPPIRGGSQPPFRTEPPPPNFPPAPLVPRLDAERVEKAETLSLPPGVLPPERGENAEKVQSLESEELPSTPLEARIYFTLRTRELGVRYREKYRIELRTDLRSIELVQRNLAERFPTGELQTEDDILEVRLHGAFVSELLARRLGAEWTDIAVSEMGYWAMNVPPGTTVWPLGRVIRFVTMQHRERDLVSYFLELQARAHGLK